MKTVQKLAGQIDAQRNAIERLNGDRNAAQAIVDSANSYVATIDELKANRRRIQAEAMIAKKTANTTAVDAQIGSAEKQHLAAQDSATTSATALEIIDEGLRIANEELTSLHEQHRAAICAEILALHDSARDRYVAAVAELEESVAVMVAANRAWDHAEYALGRIPFPARGAQVLEDLRHTGLRVPYTASRLANPDVAAEYPPDYQSYWFLPAWADPKTEAFAINETHEIVEALRKAGVDCEALPQPVPPEMQIKVRVARGEILGSPKVLRDAESGEVISQTPVVFKVGDDVYIDESTARALRSTRMVLIHGEDEMPSPNPPAADPIRVDASPPKNLPDGSYSPSGYHRPRFAIDMTDYD